MKTVRSAPVSTKISVGAHEPSAASTAHLMTGRIILSSPCTQRPAMCIDAFHFLAMNVTKEQPIIVRMSLASKRQYIGSGVRREQFLSGDTNAFAAVLGIHLGNMPL